MGPFKDKELEKEFGQYWSELKAQAKAEGFTVSKEAERVTFLEAKKEDQET